METALWQPYRGQDVVVLGLNRGESAAAIDRFVRQTGITFPVLQDRDGQVCGAYESDRAPELAPFPRDVVVDERGRVSYYHKSYRPDALLRHLPPAAPTPTTAGMRFRAYFPAALHVPATFRTSHTESR